MSKVIRVRFDFASLCLVIGLKNSLHFLDQSEVRPKPIGGNWEREAGIVKREQELLMFTEHRWRRVGIRPLSH